MKEIRINFWELSPQDIRTDIKKHGSIIFKNVLSANEINIFLKKFNEISATLKDSPSTSKPKDPISFYRKFNIGSHGKFGEFPRFFRTTYMPFWKENLSFSESIFKPIILLRNHISGVPSHFSYTEDYLNNLWSACRIQQYFVGGGFFSEHTDVVIDKISKQSNLNTIQLVALLSSKGVDYEAGGATIRDAKNKITDIESIAKSGDIIAYDGSSLHGVLPIDTHKTLDLNFTTGRIVALASIYKINKDD